MLHPSYTDLMEVVNSEVEPGEQPVVQSRYSIVIATSKRARQIIAGEEPLVKNRGQKPLSIAVEELYNSKVKIVGDEEEDLLEEQKAEENLILRNSGAIVRNTHKTDAAILDFHRNRGRARINGILHKLLYHTGRSFHHLTGSNLINCFRI